MIKFYLLCISLFSVTILTASVRQAKWSTEPSQPIYVGQQYQLCLTLETSLDEEIESFNLGNISKVPKQCTAALTDVVSHTSEIVGQHRVTKIFFEPLVALEEGIFTLPSLRPTVTLTQRIQQGFFTMSNSQVTQVSVPSYPIKVVPMREDAKGLPIGRYRIEMDVRPQTIVAGGVLELFITCTAIEGVLPKDYQFAFKSIEGCKLYPLRTLERTQTLYKASAYCVTDDDTQGSLELEPFVYFDTASRTVQTLYVNPVLFKMTPPKEIRNEVVLPSGEVVRPLRYAPSEGAPFVGALPIDVDEATLTPIEQCGAWMLIEFNGQRGWCLRNSK